MKDYCLMEVKANKMLYTNEIIPIYFTFSNVILVELCQNISFKMKMFHSKNRKYLVFLSNEGR